MSDTLAGVASVAALIFGFGFVIFWHELGHFLAAKWVGIKVEQFAVGFGNALVAWRKGVGLTFGSSEPRVVRLITDEWRRQTFGDAAPPDGVTGGPSQAQAMMLAKSLGLGETEYRLNWVPLGGYVKMLGQDDSGPVAGTSDPRAYPNKSVGARMLVISAGVVMNILLAIFGFMCLFRLGFNVTPPVVGQVGQNGPADVAGIVPGDRVLSVNGRKIFDFNGLATSVALSKDREPIPFVIERLGKDGKPLQTTITVTPRKPVAEGSAFVSVGIGPMFALAGPSGRGQHLTDAMLDERGLPDEAAIARLTSPTASAVRPHEVVTRINGQPVMPGDFLTLQRILDNNTGQPIEVTVKPVTGEGLERTTVVQPGIMGQFGAVEWSVGGLRPRYRVESVDGRGPDKAKPLAAPADGQIFPGDVILGATLAVPPYDHTPATTLDMLKKFVDSAGQQGKPVVVELLRKGVTERTQPMLPVSKKTGSQSSYRLGIGFGWDLGDMTIGGVADNSAAARAGIEAGWRLVAVNGQPVQHWLEVGRIVRNSPSGVGGSKTLKITLSPPPPAASTSASAVADVATRELVLTLDREDSAMAAIRADLPINLEVAMEVRKTDSIATAAEWGLAATRDFVLQSYVTVLRMTQRSLSPTNLQGPIGIVHTGGLIAWSKPPDWILWFICMISANLAVVNFLPLPILDGGHFVLLCLEKARGKPLSDRAMGAVQMTGLALIGCIFLFVTFNDLTRLLG